MPRLRVGLRRKAPNPGHGLMQPRGKTRRTTVPDPSAKRAPYLAKRHFKASAPNRLWVADFTYCSTWSGTVCTALVIDVFSRRIVGWRTTRTMTTDLPFDALQMAICARNERLEIWYITPTMDHSIPPFATPIDSSRPARTARSARPEIPC
jgi:transposase InsO family protein